MCRNVHRRYTITEVVRVLSRNSYWRATSTLPSKNRRESDYLVSTQTPGRERGMQNKRQCLVYSLLSRCCYAGAAPAEDSEGRSAIDQVMAPTLSAPILFGQIQREDAGNDHNATH
jgi:hypothetical protein